METAKHELPELFDRATALGGVEILETDLTTPQIVSVPAGRKLESLKPLLDQYLARPQRRVGIAHLQDLASFVAWTNRHKDTGSVIYCQVDPKAPALHAVIDYHEQGAGVSGSDVDGKARFKQFRADYAMPLDKRWVDWTGISGKAMGQAAFAAFLEDHILDLIGPSSSADATTGEVSTTLPSEVQRFLSLNGGKCATPDEVVAVSKGLEVYADTKVSERVNLQSGETAFTFEEKHRGAPDQVVVPQIFLLALPVFYLSEAHYRVPVRLRYRLHEGKVLWIPTLWQADEIFDKAVRDAATDAAKQTELPLFYGTAL